MSFPMETGGEDQGFDGQGSDVNDTSENSGGGVHPAWQEMLGNIPSELHEKVIPHLRTWDQNVQKVHQQYSPYREFSQGGWSPERLRQAVGVAQAIEQNPRGFMDVLRRHFGEDEAEEIAQQAGPQGNDWQSQLPPEVAQQLQQMQERQDLIAQVIMGEREKSQEANEDRELQSFYDYVDQTNPTYRALNQQTRGGAEKILNGFLAQGMTGQQAVDSFMSFVEGTGSFHNRPKPPPVMGSGGGLIGSNQKTNVAKLSSPETKNLVAEILRGATAANQ